MIWISWYIIRILVLRETVLSNLHTLQLTQSNHIHNRHITQTMISYFQRLQLCESSQIQHSEARFTNTIVNDDLSYTRIQRHQLIDSPNSRIWILIGDIRMISQSTSIYWITQEYNPFLNTECPNSTGMHNSWESHWWDWACLTHHSQWMRITLNSDVTRILECETEVSTYNLSTSCEWTEFGQV